MVAGRYDQVVKLLTKQKNLLFILIKTVKPTDTTADHNVNMTRHRSKKKRKCKTKTKQRQKAINKKSKHQCF